MKKMSHNDTLERNLRKADDVWILLKNLEFQKTLVITSPIRFERISAPFSHRLVH